MQAIYTINEASPMVHPVSSEAQYAIDKIGGDAQVHFSAERKTRCEDDLSQKIK